MWAPIFAIVIEVFERPFVISRGLRFIVVTTERKEKVKISHYSVQNMIPVGGWVWLTFDWWSINLFVSTGYSSFIGFSSTCSCLIASLNNFLQNTCKW